MVKHTDLGPFEQIAFEQRVSRNAIATFWRPVAAGIIADITDAIDAGDYELAFKIAENITFNAITDKLATSIGMGCSTAAIWGSDIQCGGGAESRAVASDVLFAPVENAVAQFIASLGTNAADYVRTQTATAIALIEKSRTITKSDVGTYFKAETIRRAADDALAALLNDAVMRGGTVQVAIGANLVTSKLVSYGSLAELQAQGAASYKWTSVLEPNTCQICRSLHGRTFETAPALHRLDMALRSQDANDLKSLTPFAPSDKDGLGKFFQMTNSALQSHGYGMPPIHPWCACYIVPVDHPLAQAWKDAVASVVFSPRNSGAADAADQAA